MSAGRDILEQPLFEPSHRVLAASLDNWARRELPRRGAGGRVRASTRRTLLRALGRGGHLRLCVVAPYGGRLPRLDIRALCLARETLGYHSGMADFAFASQAIATAPLTALASTAQRERLLPAVASGEALGALALAGPAAALPANGPPLTAVAERDRFWLEGTAACLPGGGDWDFCVVLAGPGRVRPGEPFSAFLIERDAPGLEVTEPPPGEADSAPVTLRFEGTRLGRDHLLGAAGAGPAVALSAFDLLRATVGAAALGFARRALDQALGQGAPDRREREASRAAGPGDARITALTASLRESALQVYRAAWARDLGAARPDPAALAAVPFGPEEARGLVERSMELGAGADPRVLESADELYRELRALRRFEQAGELARRRTLGARFRSRAR